MPSLKIKKEAIQPIIDAGIYDKWLDNLKSQWDKKFKFNPSIKAELENTTKPSVLINRAFTWEETDEGHTFWFKWKEKLD